MLCYEMGLKSENDKNVRRHMFHRVITNKHIRKKGEKKNKFYGVCNASLFNNLSIKLVECSQIFRRSRL